MKNIPRSRSLAVFGAFLFLPPLLEAGPLAPHRCSCVEWSGANREGPRCRQVRTLPQDHTPRANTSTTCGRHRDRFGQAKYAARGERACTYGQD